MSIEKKVLKNIDKIYATCLSGDNIMGASEGFGGAFYFKENTQQPLWENEGGTMNIVPFPCRDNCFFATKNFLPVFDAKDCTLNLIEKIEDEWHTTEIMKFPYLHRFDLFEKAGEIYFFGATLCTDKKHQQDWTSPGSVYFGKLSKDLKSPIKVKKIFDGITKNHGLWKEHDAYFVSGVEGIFKFTIPNDPQNESFSHERIFENEVSDLAFCDIDGDGAKELATIEGFHGDKFTIYKNHDGKFENVFNMDISFGHVLWGGQLLNENTFLLGYRKEEMKLLKITYDSGNFKVETIDINCGPSQISVKNYPDKAVILSANRQVNELCLYTLK